MKLTKTNYTIKLAAFFVPIVTSTSDLVVTPFVHEQVCGIIRSVNGTEPLVGFALLFSWVFFAIHSWQSYIQPDLTLQVFRDQVANARALLDTTNQLQDFARSLPDSPVIHYLQIDGIVTNIVIPDDLFNLRMRDLYNQSIWHSLSPIPYTTLSWQTIPVDADVAKANWDAWVNYERAKETSDAAERQVFINSKSKRILEKTIDQIHEVKKNEILSTAQKFSVVTSIIIVGVAACYYFENDCVSDDEQLKR
jgi:hypothetical protein